MWQAQGNADRKGVQDEKAIVGIVKAKGKDDKKVLTGLAAAAIADSKVLGDEIRATLDNTTP